MLRNSAALTRLLFCRSWKTSRTVSTRDPSSSMSYLVYCLVSRHLRRMLRDWSDPCLDSTWVSLLMRVLHSPGDFTRKEIFNFMAKVLGIDLGTTNSCMSVMEGGDPVVLENS